MHLQLFSYWWLVLQYFFMTCRRGSSSFLAKFCCFRSKNRATIRLRHYENSCTHRLRIVFISFSAVHTETIETVKFRLNLLFACQDNLNNLWLLLLFSKICVFNENNPSTRQRYHCVFKSFHFGDRFQTFAYSVKMVIVFYLFLCRRKVKTQKKQKNQGISSMKY